MGMRIWFWQQAVWKPVCAASSLPEIRRETQPLLPANPCVCMGTDKRILGIPETNEREETKRGEGADMKATRNTEINNAKPQ